MLDLYDGDLFKIMWDVEERLPNDFNSAYVNIAHGVNCRGQMGAGFAKQVKNKFPKTFQTYAEHCDSMRPQPGNVLEDICINPTEECRGLKIFHMFTQRNFGSWGRAELDWVKECIHVTEQLTRSAVLDTAIHAPMFGCGLGGLNWHDVRPWLERSSIHWKIYKFNPPTYKKKNRNRIIVRS